MKKGDKVKWVNQITGDEETGHLRYSYETKYGRHWSIRRGIYTDTRSEKMLELIREVIS